MALAQPRALTVPEEMRLFAGLAIQPFLAAAVAFLSFPLLIWGRDGRMLSGGYPNDSTGPAIGVAIYVGIGVVVVTAFVVFPVAVWLLKRRLATLPLCLAIGFGLGNLPFVVGTILSGGNPRLIWSHAFASLIGLTCAAAFWVIAIRGRSVLN